MNYELVKDLKDAGFLLRKNECDSVECRCEYEFLDGGFLFPTLSELIEACGDRFLGLELLDKETPYIDTGTHQEVKKWSKVFHCMSRVESLSEGMIHVYGSTPEEAVARLWLALNPKK